MTHKDAIPASGPAVGPWPPVPRLVMYVAAVSVTAGFFFYLGKSVANVVARSLGMPF